MGRKQLQEILDMIVKDEPCDALEATGKTLCIFTWKNQHQLTHKIRTLGADLECNLCMGSITNAIFLQVCITLTNPIKPPSERPRLTVRWVRPANKYIASIRHIYLSHKRFASFVWWAGGKPIFHRRKTKWKTKKAKLLLIMTAYNGHRIYIQ